MKLEAHWDLFAVFTMTIDSNNDSLLDLLALSALPHISYFAACASHFGLPHFANFDAKFAIQCALPPIQVQ